ncbi:hypothetical protein [Paraphotobacterium marinum]|uniref:hypothetical protein n=1 Tax=Paraphotobacterium marinum TaxID=1755811 RepID=UPI001314523F|nr:hypothetical protein [Paraphotobacterium marinum]
MKKLIPEIIVAVVLFSATVSAQAMPMQKRIVAQQTQLSNEQANYEERQNALYQGRHNK